jgi:hypothetical protein
MSEPSSTEIRAARQVMADYMNANSGRLKRDTVIQAVGMITALCWVLGDEIVDTPGYVNPIPEMLRQMQQATADPTS